MYSKFVEDTIKEFEYNYEEQRNRFCVEYFNPCRLIIGNSNFYICGYNFRH
jgi:hypothetical protein